MIRSPRPQSSLRSFKISIVAVFVIIMVGAAGFYYIEVSHQPDNVESLDQFLNAVYWAIETATTIGYGDIVPKTWWGRLFTAIFAIVSVVTIAWAGANALAFIVEGHLSEAVRERKMLNSIKKLKNHYIICGLGRVGMEVVNQFRNQDLDFVVIDHSREVMESSLNEDELRVVGNTTEEHILKEAQIETAYGLIACIPNDADNVFTILTAKGMNPDIFIISRGLQNGSQNKLLRAGADRVVMPSRIGGARMAAMALRPAIVDFLDQTLMVPGDQEPLLLEQIQVVENSPLNGKQLRETHIKSETEVMIVGIRPARGETIINPPSNYVIQQGDMLIGLGHHSQFQNLRRLIGVEVLPD